MPDAQAAAAFEILIPVVETDPSARDAVDAARGVIARCVPGGDSPLACVLDWWFVATTGEASANGGAHRLPESLEEPPRLSMEAVMGLASDRPAAEWLDKERQLDLRLADLDNTLSLDSHGQSKLPGERVAWEWLLEQLDPAIGALRTSRRTDSVEVAPRQLQAQLRDNGIEQGSRRWREMLKRCDETVSGVKAMIELQKDVQPWIRRSVPPLLESVPDAFAAAIGPLAPSLLRPLLAANAAPDVDRLEVARRLDAVARSADGAGRYRLARLADSWCEKTGNEIPALVELIERHRRVREGARLLRDKHHVDTEDVQINILEDDIDAAEAALGELRSDHELRQRLQRTRSQYDGLSRKVADADLGEDDEWRRLLSGIGARLDDGDPQELAREIGALQRRLSKELDEALREHRQDLNSRLDALRQLGAADSRLFDWRRQIEQIAVQAAGRGGSDLKTELETEADALRGQIRSEVELQLDEVEKILTEEREDFTEAYLGVFANRQSGIESLLHEQEVSDSELVGAKDDSRALLRELGDHRIHRWTAEEGEPCLVEHIVEYCTSSLHFHHEDIRRLHVALKTKPFVILAGLTGSGKSSLIRLYAAAVGANTANGQFRRVAVRPDWIDQSEVLGFVNPVSQRFVPGWLAETVRHCERNPDRLHFVLLDEMNLAPVEHYLAELLSAMEEARSGSADVRLPLYSRGEQPQNADEWPADLQYPHNLFVVGTVNVDETTRPLSERVIDRANVLQLSVDISERHHHAGAPAPATWLVSSAAWRDICVSEPTDAHHAFLVDLADILRRTGIGVGLRSHVELERFLANASGVIDEVEALDWGIVQRVIPKIRGFKGSLSEALDDLKESFESVGANQSASIVRRWLDDRISDDEYLDGTDPRLTLART